jgi:hypothetical protein
MTYVKHTAEETVYPYTLKDLKADYPNTSFPPEPTNEALAEFNVFPVTILNQPSYNPNTQKIKENDLPTLNDEVWELGWTVTDLSAEELVIRNEAAGEAVRGQRDAFLAETDWRFRSDMNPSQEWIDYCQALRDVPQQEGFPTTVNWPTKPV